ncbi:putative mitochondrial protein [Cardamine amara subsp. amara]|uniref:Mitochondrial protein n=1 Tax=Cardamine amara subsp. amara TaxID=228776 RepID=A0ABD1A4Q3_CARAN
MCKKKNDGGLGSKQAWRLLSNPLSLVSRIYKSRYYAKKSFLEAGPSYRPSYAWRSILHGRELLETGLMKAIGNGKDTDVWCDKWVFDEDPWRPINIQRTMEITMKVANLIQDDGTWDLIRMQEIFTPGDISKISAFPPNLEVGDSYIWAYSRNDAYSVKSGNWIVSKPRPGENFLTQIDQEGTTRKVTRFRQGY